MDAVGLLLLYECGRDAGPIDRAALLAGAMLGDDARQAPLGDVDRAIWGLRARVSSGPAEALASCPECGAELEFALPADFAPPDAVAPHAEVTFKGQRYDIDLPRLCDITADGVALSALADDAPWDAAEFRAAAERALETADPGLRLRISLDCAECGAGFDAPLDIPAFLWRELAASGRRLVGEVASLARTFGWSEDAILAMSPARRALYLAEITP